MYRDPTHGHVQLQFLTDLQLWHQTHLAGTWTTSTDALWTCKIYHDLCEDFPAHSAQDFHLLGSRQLHWPHCDFKKAAGSCNPPCRCPATSLRPGLSAETFGAWMGRVWCAKAADANGRQSSWHGSPPDDAHVSFISEPDPMACSSNARSPMASHTVEAEELQHGGPLARASGPLISQRFLLRGDLNGHNTGILESCGFGWKYDTPWYTLPLGDHHFPFPMIAARHTRVGHGPSQGASTSNRWLIPQRCLRDRKTLGNCWCWILF